MNFLWSRLFGRASQSKKHVSEVQIPIPVKPHKTYAGRAEIFDPALIPNNALRSGDPDFSDSGTAQRWQVARRQVIDYLIHLIATSDWSDHLVLRGSLLLKVWLGAAAREPNDIDWVFRPSDVALGGPECQSLFDDLLRMVSDQPHVGNAAIQSDQIVTDDIWTYERAAGRRLIIPWLFDALPAGEVQMDIVFEEELFAAPIRTTLPLSSGESVTVWSANQELSLAWKLLWLKTDSHPQGKDLYDATLLAEKTGLSLSLFNRVLASANPPLKEMTPDFPIRWKFVDWKNFKLECPWVQGDVIDWQSRLTAALAPMFYEHQREGGPSIAD